VQNHYELLSVPPNAAPAEIKRAFRQEIARYHPDKVHHLGQEFQAMAATRAAQLTEAYRVLMDAARRAEYDELLAGVGALRQSGDQASTSAPASPPPPDAEPEPRHRGADRRSPFSSERESCNEFVRRATFGRLRQALTEEFGEFDEAPAKGFEFGCAPKSRKLFGRSSGPRFVAKMVSRVDRAAVQQTWAMASKAGGDREICVFLMGGGLAPARELTDAIAGEQRKHMSAQGRVVVIPIDVRDWQALIPKDAPPSCKSILKRLREAGGA
jgi:hypothetical protein